MRVFSRFEGKKTFFDKPQAVISCFDPDSFGSVLIEMERALRSGYYLAGFFSYEAGYRFENVLNDNKKPDFPFVYFGVYKRPSSCNISIPKKDKTCRISSCRLNMSREKYFSNIEKIRGHISRGEVYQVTYCLKYHFQTDTEPVILYDQLFRAQPVPYSAFIQDDHFSIISLSPEMFLKKEGRFIKTKPMKGTWMRPDGFLRDLLARIRFQHDPKNRAENLMIADLLRNDLGRVGEGIRAPKLFEVAKYRTLYQMTSTVTGKVIAGVALDDLFRSLFPSGSVTGAPKISAMRIIKELEEEERRIYTGAIGYITPDKDMFFNIPIRTILLNGQQGEMGIGGGIVWDSTPLGEWEEGLLKAKFFTDYSRQE